MSATFIAEIKTQSPFGYKSPNSFVELMEYAVKYGDWISVHTNALWGGDYDAISFVRRQTSKPILAKGIHATDDDIERAIDHGADYVLVVDRFPYQNLLSKCLIELSSLCEFERMSSLFPNVKFVHNSRNLNTGRYSQHSLDDFLKCSPKWLCQASNIMIPQSVNRNVQAFIVGQHLVDFCKQL